MRRSPEHVRCAAALPSPRLLTAALLLAVSGCGGGGASGGPTPPALEDVVVQGLLPYAVHTASLAQEIVLETRVLTPAGAPHPTAVLSWRYPGKTYQGFTPDPDPDLSFVEETGPGGLHRLRIRSSRPKRGGLFASCIADVFSGSPNVPVRQAVCEDQALRFWGGPPSDLLFPFSAVTMGVGEVRPLEPLVVSAYTGTSHEPATCSSSSAAVATAVASGSICTVTARAAGSATLTFTAGGVTRDRPLTVTAAALGPPGVGAVAGLAPQVATPGIMLPILRSQGEDIPANLLAADPGGAVAFAAAQASRQPVFRWTGTGFGYTFASPPELETTFPGAVAFDGRGVLHAVVGTGAVAAQGPADPPGTWRRVALPASAWVTGVERSQLDDSSPIPRAPEGSAWFSLLPRSGGGVWVAWVTVKGWADVIDKVCRFNLELASIDADLVVHHETVLTAEKRWARVLAGGASFDCLSGFAPYDHFVEPVPQLLQEGPHGKPDLDLLRHDSVFPFEAALPHAITLTPAGLTHRHLQWDGAAWTSDALFAPGTTRAVARSPSLPPLLLGAVSRSLYTTAESLRDRQRPYLIGDDPERFFLFDDPRLVYRSQVGAASVPLPGHKVFELDGTIYATGWRVIDLPADQPPQQLFPLTLDGEPPIVRPPVVLADGRRFAFMEQVDSPFLCTEPGARVVSAPAEGGPWGVAAEPATLCALPLPFERLKGRAFPLGGQVVLLGVENDTGAPLAACSPDGLSWTRCHDGAPVPGAVRMAPGWVRPDGSAFALDPGLGGVYRTADLMAGVWTLVDDLRPQLTAEVAALSNVARDVTWVEAADGGSVALLAVPNVAGGVAGAGPRLLVRRYSLAGAPLDSAFAPLPGAIQLGLGDRFEPTGAALVGDRLYLTQGTAAASELALSPLTYDLAADTWAAGPVVARIYGGDPYGQNHWHWGLEDQFDMLSRDFFAPLLYKPLPGGQVWVLGSAIRPDGREAIFHALAPAADTLVTGAKTYLRPDGGFHQRVVDAVPEPGGGWYLLYGDGARPYMQFGALEHAWVHLTP